MQALEAFIPGADYGQPFEVIIGVCCNTTARSFEQCNAQAGPNVLEALKQWVQQRGLSRRVIVTPTGCLLGCKSQGTSVMVSWLLQANAAQCFNNITLEQLSALTQYIQQRL